MDTERDKKIAAVYPWYEPHQRWLRKESGGVRADLRGADLRDADLSYATLSGANLSGANLSYANLTGADLRDADLRVANLSGANLSYANLSDANLTGADLRVANLTIANLRGADLSDANLSYATLSGATMPGFDGDPPTSLAEAAKRTRDWLSEDGRWVKGKWINTPEGAYSGHCSACLHGAAVYVGGPFGPQLSTALEDAGFTVDWNDEKSRTVNDVLEALDQIAEQADTPA